MADAVLHPNGSLTIQFKPGQCPACWNENSVILTTEPHKEYRRVFYKGKEFSRIETTILQCDLCGRKFTQRNYFK